MKKKRTVIVIQRWNRMKREWEDIRQFEANQVKEVSDEMQVLRRNLGFTYHVIQRRIRNDESTNQ